MHDGLTADDGEATEVQRDGTGFGRHGEGHSEGSICDRVQQHAAGEIDDRDLGVARISNNGLCAIGGDTDDAWHGADVDGVCFFAGIEIDDRDRVLCNVADNGAFAIGKYRDVLR